MIEQSKPSPETDVIFPETKTEIEPGARSPEVAEKREAEKRLEFFNLVGDKFTGLQKRVASLRKQVEGLEVPQNLREGFNKSLTDKNIMASRLLRTAVYFFALSNPLNLEKVREFENAPQQQEFVSQHESDGSKEKKEQEAKARTEHIIKVISGQEDLTAEEKEIIIKNLCKIQIFRSGKPGAEQVLAIINNLTFEQLVEKLDAYQNSLNVGKPSDLTPEDSFKVYTTMYESKNGQIVITGKEFNKAGTQNNILRALGRFEFDPNLVSSNQTKYQALRRLHQECGAPPIKLRLGDPNYDPKTDFTNRSHYNVEDSQLVVDLQDGRDNVIAEMAHHVQYSLDRSNAMAQGRKDAETVSKVVGINEQETPSPEQNRAFGRVYDAKIYNTPGSVEDVAHHTIEPILKQHDAELQAGKARKFKAVRDLGEYRYQLEQTEREEIEQIENRLKDKMVQELEAYAKSIKPNQNNVDAVTYDRLTQERDDKMREKRFLLYTEYMKNRDIVVLPILQKYRRLIAETEGSNVWKNFRPAKKP